MSIITIVVSNETYDVLTSMRAPKDDIKKFSSYGDVITELINDYKSRGGI